VRDGFAVSDRDSGAAGERIEFRIHVGRCGCCRRRVQGRHPRQTSNAIGGAASQLGPRALALATLLNKGLGLPYGKSATVLEQAFGLRVSRGGLCQAIARAAEKTESTYQALVEQVRGSPSVTPDETGWKVGGQLWWMWVFSTPQVAVYAIQLGRGFEQAARVLGADFAGFLVRDGWAIYRRFLHALYQSCLAHLLRRCREMILVAGKREAEFPRGIQALLQQTLQLRHRRQQKQISDHGVAVARGQLEAKLDRSLQRCYRSPRNRRLANHLLRERDALFTFLNCPGLEATNWRAEQAIRPMVVARKVWGGNRTPRSADAKHLGQHSADLPPATTPCLVFPAEADLLPSAQGHGLDPASCLQVTLDKFLRNATLRPLEVSACWQDFYFSASSWQTFPARPMRNVFLSSIPGSKRFSLLLRRT
jgi:transposase